MDGADTTAFLTIAPLGLHDGGRLAGRLDMVAGTIVGRPRRLMEPPAWSCVGHNRVFRRAISGGDRFGIVSRAPEGAPRYSAGTNPGLDEPGVGACRDTRLP